MKKPSKKMIGTAVVLTAATAAAAAGAYWLYGSANAPRHRKMAKAWMLKARAAVMEQMEKIQDIDKDKYLALAEAVAREYGREAGATGKDIAYMASELKRAWTHVQASHAAAAPRKPRAKASGRGRARKKSEEK